MTLANIRGRAALDNSRPGSHDSPHHDRHRHAPKTRPRGGRHPPMSGPTATEIAAALGERAEDVCRRYLPRGRKHGRYWTAGDITGAPGRSLFVRLRPPGQPGKWTDAAAGTHGDLLDLIQVHTGGGLGPALAEARAFLALPPMVATTNDQPGAVPAASERTAAARRLWRACRPIDGTLAEAYLYARGISRGRFPALRFHPNLNYREQNTTRRFPALVAAVSEPATDAAEGAITGIHRTWLGPGRPAKAAVARPRKALGRVHGHAVRLGVPSTTLIVGEGIETVLSIVTVLPRTAAAAALSAGSLGAFAPPPGVSRILIAQDNDPAGERAAQRLAARCSATGLAAIVLIPEHGDFNDDLMALGPGVLAARLAPLLASAPPPPPAPDEEAGARDR